MVEDFASLLACLPSQRHDRVVILSVSSSASGLHPHLIDAADSLQVLFYLLPVIWSLELTYRVRSERDFPSLMLFLSTHILANLNRLSDTTRTLLSRHGCCTGSFPPFLHVNSTTSVQILAKQRDVFTAVPLCISYQSRRSIRCDAWDSVINENTNSSPL